MGATSPLEGDRDCNSLGKREEVLLGIEGQHLEQYTSEGGCTWTTVPERDLPRRRGVSRGTLCPDLVCLAATEGRE